MLQSFCMQSGRCLFFGTRFESSWYVICELLFAFCMVVFRIFWLHAFCMLVVCFCMFPACLLKRFESFQHAFGILSDDIPVLAHA